MLRESVQCSSHPTRRLKPPTRISQSSLCPLPLARKYTSKPTGPANSDPIQRHHPFQLPISTSSPQASIAASILGEAHLPSYHHLSPPVCLAIRVTITLPITSINALTHLKPPKRSISIPAPAAQRLPFLSPLISSRRTPMPLISPSQLRQTDARVLSLGQPTRLIAPSPTGFSRRRTADPRSTTDLSPRYVDIVADPLRSGLISAVSCQGSGTKEGTKERRNEGTKRRGWSVWSRVPDEVCHASYHWSWSWWSKDRVDCRYVGTDSG